MTHTEIMYHVMKKCEKARQEWMENPTPKTLKTWGKILDTVELLSEIITENAEKNSQQTLDSEQTKH